MLLLTIVGGFGALSIALACGIWADHLLASWKLGESGTFVAAIGFSLAALNQILIFPANILSFGSRSTTALAIAGVACFVLWGFVFALISRRILRPKRAGT
jgi:hypothetical protein